jgi:hypothetical protein
MAAKQPQLTASDRLISALMGGILGFGTMLVIWFIVMYVGGRAGRDVSFPFYWVWIAAGLVAAVGFLAGPEKLMDGIGGFWGAFGKLLFWRAREDSSPASRRRRSR